MQKSCWSILVLSICHVIVLNGQILFPGLQGQALLDAVVEGYRPTTVLSYSDARDTMYANIYKVNDSIACVYSGHKVFLPQDVDPSTWLSQNGNNNGINCEHTYPQSKGASSGNPESDMHHLFPSRAGVNTARDNFPFKEIPDDQTTQWYYKENVSSTPPSTEIELYSERKQGFFEPREDHKGNVARAIFYFYSMYKAEADAADPSFFAIQQNDLCAWHFLDPADSLEFKRTWQIAGYQDGLPNPFVLDCTLASRIYCQGIPDDCINPPTTTLEVDKSMQKTLKIFPNPAGRGVFSIDATAPGYLSIYNALGGAVMERSWQPGELVVSDGLPIGIYFVRLEQKAEVLTGRVVIEDR